MQKLPKLSGPEVVKALLKAGFVSKRHKGSHTILIKETKQSKIGVVVPLHNELKFGTLKGILKQADIREEDFLMLL